MNEEKVREILEEATVEKGRKGKTLKRSDMVKDGLAKGR